MSRILVLCLCASFASTFASEAQTKPSDAEAVVEVTTRVYDVRDLLAAPRNYPLEPSMLPTTPGDDGSGSDGGRAIVQSPAPPRPTPGFEDLTQFIMATVASETWKENGGVLGSARALAGSLVITQTPANHVAIESMLGQLRSGGVSEVVRVEVLWLLMGNEDLDWLRQNSTTADFILPDSMTTNARIYSRGQTIGFNGQTVHIASGMQRSYVSGLTPVVGTGAVGYQPTISTVHNGVAFQVTPQTVPGLSAVVLDVKSIVSEVGNLGGGVELQALVGATTRPASDGAASAGMPFVDRTNVLSQQFQTRARVPMGKTALLGGMTLEPSNAGKATSDGPRQLYLAVRVTTSPERMPAK